MLRDPILYCFPQKSQQINCKQNKLSLDKLEIHPHMVIGDGSSLIFISFNMSLP